MTHSDYMKLAIEQAKLGRDAEGGGPFGAVVVREGEIVCAVHNWVKGEDDVTQHAELHAIQVAGAKIGRKNLKECILYTSCEPCMMCLGACYWAGFQEIYFGASAEDARDHGYVYSQSYYSMPQHIRHTEFKMVQLYRRASVAIWKNE